MLGINFGHPWVFFFFLLFLGYVFWNQSRSGTLHFSREKTRKKYPIFFIILWLLLNLTLADPHISFSEKKAQAQNTYILFSIDISGSMEARDYGNISRLEMIKKEIQEIISEKNPGYLYGIQVFSGKSFIHTPFTDDVFFLQEMLSTITTQSIKNNRVYFDGSNLADALYNGIEYMNARVNSSGKKYILPFSDGQFDNSFYSPEKISKLSQEYEITLFPIIIGSQEPYEFVSGNSKTILTSDKKYLGKISTNGDIYDGSSSEKIQEFSNDFGKIFPGSYIQKNTTHSFSGAPIFFGLFCLGFGVQIFYFFSRRRYE